MSHAWHYAQDGKALGPVGETGLRALIAAGTVTPETLVWRNGLAGWEPAGQHLSFAPPAPATPEVEAEVGAEAEDQPSGPRYYEPTGREPGDWVARARAKAAADGPWQDQTQSTAQTQTAKGGWSGGAGSSARLGRDGLYVGAPSRSLREAISICLSKYFTFSGRASRSEYWWFIVFCSGINLILNLLAALGFVPLAALSGLVSLGLIIPATSVMVRRLHDTDRSGWWVLGSILLSMINGLVIIFTVSIAISMAEDPSAGFSAMSGVIIAIAAVTLLYSLAVFVFLCSRGTPGPNRFG